jgi:hypothetical protein
MSEAAEPARAGAAGKERILPVVAPALVLLSIVATFLRYNDYALLLPESLILLAAAAAIGMLVGAIAQLRPQTLAPLLMALVLTVYVLSRDDVTGLLRNAVAAISGHIGHSEALKAIALAGIYAALSVICVLLRRNLALIATAVFGTMVVATLILPAQTGGMPVVTGTLPAKLNDLPPVIHVILDEHIGIAGLPPERPESADAADAMRSTFSDFALYSHAYSRFAETKYSLTSLFNRDVGADVGQLLEGELTEFAPKRNAWFETLKARGYAIRVYQSAWLNMCGPGSKVDTCYTYRFFSPNALQRSSLTTRQRLQVLLPKLFFGRGVLRLEPLTSMETLARFRADIAEAPRGVAYFVHVLIPHANYLYTRDCALRPPSDWLFDGGATPAGDAAEERSDHYGRYLGQLICADRQMQSLFAYLKTLGIYDEATIIVHGDHGSRIAVRPAATKRPELLDDQDKRDNFVALLAIKAPGVVPGVHDEPVALQRLFADRFLGGARPDSPAPGTVFVRSGRDDRLSPIEIDWAKETGTARNHLAAAAELEALGELRR